MFLINFWNNKSISLNCMTTDYILRLIGGHMKQKTTLISILVVALVFGGVLISGCVSNNNNNNNNKQPIHLTTIVQ